MRNTRLEEVRSLLLAQARNSELMLDQLSRDGADAEDLAHEEGFGMALRWMAYQLKENAATWTHKCDECGCKFDGGSILGYWSTPDSDAYCSEACAQDAHGEQEVLEEDENGEAIEWNYWWTRSEE